MTNQKKSKEGAIYQQIPEEKRHFFPYLVKVMDEIEEFHYLDVFYDRTTEGGNFINNMFNKPISKVFEIEKEN